MTNQNSAPSALDRIEEQGMAAAELCVRAADLLNLALDQSGKTQKELAERLGIGESRVSQVLRGDGNFHVATLGRFLRAIGYSAKIILEAADEDVPAFEEPKPKKRRNRKNAPATDYTHVIKQPYLDGSGATWAFTVLTSADPKVCGWFEHEAEVITVNGVTGETTRSRVGLPRTTPVLQNESGEALFAYEKSGASASKV